MYVRKETPTENSKPGAQDLVKSRPLLAQSLDIALVPVIYVDDHLDFARAGGKGSGQVSAMPHSVSRHYIVNG